MSSRNEHEPPDAGAPRGAERNRGPAGLGASVVVLLVAWLAAAVAAGIPDDAAGTAANAKSAAAQTPSVQNTGPECFAGHAPPPAASKSRD